VGEYIINKDKNKNTKQNTADSNGTREIKLSHISNPKCSCKTADSDGLFDKKIATERESLPLEKLRWLSSSEAAQYLRVSEGSIKNMVYRGQLSPKKLGRLNRFLREDLERALSSPFCQKGEF
jgi:excisionase family DNA binding protein